MLLGGLAGVLLTLVAAIVWSGTVDFAPRRQVEALSSNVNTMQSNQELAWERLDSLDIGAGELSRRSDRAEAELDSLVTDVAAAEKRVADAEQRADETEQEITALQEQLTAATTEMGGRIQSVETSMQTVDAQVSEISDLVGKVNGQVDRFSQFFDALRDMLVSMQGE